MAGSIYSDWSGPSSCPDGVAGATEDQTAVSCVGRCLAPSVMADFISDNYFDLDALCPEVRVCVSINPCELICTHVFASACPLAMI